MHYKQTQSFLQLIKEIDSDEYTQRDRGTLFELLSKAYFKHEPMYRQLFDEVWMLNEVPEEYEIAKHDTGVDLVARKRGTGELIAIQCKYYGKDATISKGIIDSFLNELGKIHYVEGIIISSTDNWTNNAEDALKERSKPVTRIGLSQLSNSKVDWSTFSFNQPEQVELQDKKDPLSHQIPAIEAVLEGFKTVERGKLIMAPGTGKTYTSMVIAERLAEKKNGTYRVLYLVPSIQLLSQSLRSWTGDTNYTMETIAVCSDRKVTKDKSNDEFSDITAPDIGYPATTNHLKLLEYQDSIEASDDNAKMLVVFSTYQSIEVISEAQKNGFYEFDLIISDEAHRTTGATRLGEDESSFVKVHSNENVKATKRLYQTATPRIYDDRALAKAERQSIIVADMNDTDLYGEELFRLGFGEAVHRNILSDYKVMVLAVDENMVQKQFQQMFAEKDNELQFNDVTKIIGCWNGLLKRKSNSDELFGKPMKRAIAFTGTIAQSKQITERFNQVVNHYLEVDDDIYDAFKVEIDHADGTMNALQKNKKIEWLKSDVPDKTCRILSNARFLTEGVDIPELDAVLFLQPRRSVIDIAQAVGRVMRKVDGKDYGYVILPIGVPSGEDPNEVLDRNENYQSVWQVLNALRSIDERFDAMVNKIELNKKKPKPIDVIGVGGKPEIDDEGEFIIDKPQDQLDFFTGVYNLTGLERAIYGKIVEKVGNTRYWETWSKDVADLAQLHITRINAMLEEKSSDLNVAFKRFLKGLRHNINSTISLEDAVEMIAQHAITKPVFDALFEEESFALNNPVSVTMNEMIKVLESYGFTKEQEKLEGFYESVRMRAQEIDNLESKQKIIVQLYEKFFKVGFSRTTDKLGIVFTPIEVVDYIINSVEFALQKHLGTSLNNKNVNILDPFTGTGTFITRLLQSAIIDKENLLYKYTNEIYANEIVLLSYYIAAINIEETFKEMSESERYVPFPGIVFTDTFQSTEHDHNQQTIDDSIFADNNERLKKQQESPITVIMSNPPYNAKQDQVNDANQKSNYLKLDYCIKNTYVKNSTANNMNNIYDSYFRAFRWASDRIGTKGIIGFVTNGTFIDGLTSDGFRKSLYEEFNYIYVFNLRGNARTSGEQRRKEAGNIFESGSRAPIAISILVKDGSDNHNIFYRDIGDYLSRDEKLINISENNSISGTVWEEIVPDVNNDWIGKRNKDFKKFISLSDDKDSIFFDRGIGFSSSRDFWVIGFSKDEIKTNTEILTKNFNNMVESIREEEKLDMDLTRINWSDDLLTRWERRKKIDFTDSKFTQIMYRPFVKKHLNNLQPLIKRPSQWSKFMDANKPNMILNFPGGNKTFSVLVTNEITDYQFLGNTKSIPLYINRGNDLTLLNDERNINEKYLINNMTDEELFAYIYGILHSEEYREKYENDLRKDIPRIPKIKNYEEFMHIGEQLIDLHLNYNNVPPYKDLIINYKNSKPSYKVDKMRFKKIRDTNGKLEDDKSTIIFNKDIEVSNIPLQAYNYIVNNRSPIEWIIDQYQIKTDKKSGITDDPNKYSDDEKYIFNLLLSIINVSIQTVDLVNNLPPLDIIEE